MKQAISSLIILLSYYLGFAQSADTVMIHQPQAEGKEFGHIASTLNRISDRRTIFRQLIGPTAIITYGVVSLNNDGLQQFNQTVKQAIWNKNPHNRTNLDDYIEFLPGAVVYGLNLVGIKGRHNLRDRTFLYLLSDAIMGISVTSLKNVTHVLRPDGSSYDAFPSGHTATAFVSAEFLNQEYGRLSPWISVGGYSVATLSAYLGLHDNKHWFNDVVMAVGVGILSTKIAYWVYPIIQRKLFRHQTASTMLFPFYQQRTAGLCFVSAIR